MKLLKKEIEKKVRVTKDSESFPPSYTFSGDVDFNNLNFQFEKVQSGSSYITVQEKDENLNDGCPECSELPTFEATKKQFVADIYNFINK